MKQNMKFILLAVLAVLIAATAFMGGWLASQKAAQPTKAEVLNRRLRSKKAPARQAEPALVGAGARAGNGSGQDDADGFVEF